MKHSLILILGVSLWLVLMPLTAGHEAGLSKETAPVRALEPIKGPGSIAAQPLGLGCQPNFGKVPLYFIPNRGQVNENARFYAKTSRYTLWMTKQGLVFDRIRSTQPQQGSPSPLSPSSPIPDRTMSCPYGLAPTYYHSTNRPLANGYWPPYSTHSTTPQIERVVTRLVFLNANKNPEIVPLEPTPHQVNYFIGKDPSRWRKGISTSKAVLYKGLYQNIDLKVYGNESQVEYDWIVKPGGNPADIRFAYQNVKSSHIDEEGNLVIDSFLGRGDQPPFGKLLHRQPLGYQWIDGKKVEVRTGFSPMGKNTYGFVFGKYDKNDELILDPVVSLEYSTYLGGSGEELYARMAVDIRGQVHVTGYTYSDDFPTLNAYQGNPASTLLDAVITRFDSNGTDLVFSSYFGGTGSEYFFAIAVAENGDVYIGGDTFSSDLPAINSPIGGKDVFLARFDSTGNFLGGRYLGGTGEDRNLYITLDNSGHLWVTGFTASTDFPTKNPYQNSNPGYISAYVCKLSPGLQDIEYSTYLGGAGEDVADRIAVDSLGYIYVAGRTGSGDFPLKNAWQNQYAGGVRDVFLTKFEPDGSALVFSTLIGGTGDELPFGLAFGPSGEIYVGGFTDSTDFPTKNPFQAANRGDYDIFISSFPADGSRLLYSTYLGGTGEDWHGALVVDPAGNIYVTGSTYSADFPVKIPFQSTYGGARDAFLSILAPGGANLVYSTYFGGSGWERCLNIGRDAIGNIYLAGETQSPDLPVSNSFQPTLGGSADFFAAKFTLGWTLTVQSGANTGVPISVAPADIDGKEMGFTPFTRTYRVGEAVTLTAPETFNNKIFYKWTWEGANYFDRTLPVTVEKDQTITVEYHQARAITLSRSRMNFGVCPPVAASPQAFLISHSGSPMDWTIAADSAWLSCSPASGAGPAEVTVSVDAAGLAAGTYHGQIIVTAPGAINSPQVIPVTLAVYPANAGSVPFGYFETPIDGAYVYSSIPVTGWVLDDTGVESVKIYREAEAGNNLVYIGDALFVEGARPDVELAYPGYPYSYKAGWGYMMLTNFLPNGGNGTFRIHAIATDSEGHQLTLGVHTIVCDNADAVKPFGAIDIPGQGGIASGSLYRNQGWVLTPPPNYIPKDGHTIRVWIDGHDVGQPHYDIYRPDVAALFPGYANSNGSLAYFDFDTHLLDNGIHTLQWTAVDSAGNVDGIGSRYFFVRNIDARQPAAAKTTDGALIKKAPYDSNPIKIKRGWQQGEFQEVYPDREGKTTIEMSEVGRIEIHLPGNTGWNTGQAGQKSQGAGLDEKEWQGFLQVGEQMRGLPIGSSLDTGKGIFYWNPGPGFLGVYRLVFVESGQNREIKKKDIVIKISPRDKVIF